jgi:hypothetical protein
MKSHRFILYIILIFILAACNLPKSMPEPTFDPNAVATMVEETMAGFPSPTAIAATLITVPPTSSPISLPSPTPSTGKAAGKICYPSSGRTDMRGFFQETARGVVTELSISANAIDYEIVLDPGSYIAYVWLPDFSFSGMYSTGKQPTPFEVIAGQTTFAIDLCDWSHGPFDVPYPPGLEPQQTTGSISGSIGYPYGDIPQLTLVAFSKSTPYWYWVGTAPGQSYYTISNLPPGNYQVVAYDGSGHAGGSSIVSVIAGQTATANVSDWGGSYPSNPVK